MLYTLEEEDPTELDDLVDEVVTKQLGSPPTEVADGVREDLRVQLHHRYLPKLCDLGIVEYDPRSSAIQFRQPPPRLDEFLHLAKELESE